MLSGRATRRVATRALARQDDGTLQWVPGGLDRVEQALNDALDEGTASEAIDDLLRLMVVLRTKRSSPGAADRLAELLRAVPGALAVMQRRHQGRGGLDARRRFARREGRHTETIAPRADDERPQGTLQLKALLDPTDRDHTRQIARRRKEIQDGRG